MEVRNERPTAVLLVLVSSPLHGDLKLAFDKRKRIWLIVYVIWNGVKSDDHRYFSFFVGNTTTQTHPK